jgi:hypothetical protein
MWRVVVEAKPDGLPVGRHQAQVHIRTDCPEAPVNVVLVELDLRGPVQAVPEHLAFGTLSPGTPARRKVVLRYDMEGAHSSPLDVCITHNLGRQLQVSYAPNSAARGELSAVLTPSERAADGELKGLVVVTFGARDLLPLEIPVSAKVRQP